MTSTRLRGTARAPCIDRPRAVARRLLAGRRGTLRAVALLLSTAPAWGQAPGGISREYAIKAAFLYNFATYVRWPEHAFQGPEHPFVIGLLGQDPFSGTLDRIAREKRVEGRAILVQRFASLDEYIPCHILFVTSSVPASVQEQAIDHVHESSGVLLVGERPGFAARGGVINFYIEQNKVRFEVNVRAAQQQELKISSQVLGLARLVEHQ